MSNQQTNDTPVLFHLGANVVRTIPNNAGTLVQRLPSKIYSVEFSPMSGYFLKPDVEITGSLGSLYGNVSKIADRVLDTYFHRNKSTGAAFYGEKGTGKSLQIREICHKALARGLPVLLVSEQYSGDDFNQFIADIRQKAVVVFEEFDKVYHDNDAVNSLLTLLDGLYNSDKLYLFSTNSALPTYMSNRPSRIYYAYEYGKHIAKEIIEQYCADNLKDTSRIEDILKLSIVAPLFNFDMLQTLVEEMNRYPEESLSTLMDSLNVEASLEYAEFNIRLTNKNGEDITVLYDIPSYSDNYLSGPCTFRLQNHELSTRIKDPLRAPYGVSSDVLVRLKSLMDDGVNEATLVKNIGKYVDGADSRINIAPEMFQLTDQGCFIAVLENGVTVELKRRQHYSRKFL